MTETSQSWTWRSAAGLAGLMGAVMLTVDVWQRGTRVFPALLAATLLIAALTLGTALWWRRAASEVQILVNLRPPHWVQACVQSSIYAIVGFFYAGVAEYAPLVLFQLAFFFLFQNVLLVVLRRRFEISFSVCPIVLSINLFLWFRPEYFALQLLMVSVGVLSKHVFLRGGRHIFNPSGIAMALTLYLLIAFQRTDMLFPGFILAFTDRPSLFLLHIFVVSAISLTLADRFLVTLGGFSVMVLAYYGCQAVWGLPALPWVMHPNTFIGFTLLVTDPATSPRHSVGKLVYGIAYGASVILSFALLDNLGVSPIFDKLLFVPLLNFAVPYFEQIDEAVSSHAPRLPQRVGRWLPAAVYAALFLTTAVPYPPERDRTYLLQPAPYAQQHHLDAPGNARNWKEANQLPTG